MFQAAPLPILRKKLEKSPVGDEYLWTLVKYKHMWSCEDEVCYVLSYESSRNAKLNENNACTNEVKR